MIANAQRIKFWMQKSGKARRAVWGEFYQHSKQKRSGKNKKGNMLNIRSRDKKDAH